MGVSEVGRGRCRRLAYSLASARFLKKAITSHLTRVSHLNLKTRQTNGLKLSFFDCAGRYRCVQTQFCVIKEMHGCFATQDAAAEPGLKLMNIRNRTLIIALA